MNSVRQIHDVSTENPFPATTGPGSSPAESTTRICLRYWLPVFLWIALIFGLSTDAGSSRHTSRFIRPFLRWLNPEMSEANIRRVHTAIRKAAHLSEYAVMAILLWRVLSRIGREEQRGWSRGGAVQALSFVALLAATDEWHQTFSSGREGQISDVFLDLFGAALGLAAIWLVGRRSHQW